MKTNHDILRIFTEVIESATLEKVVFSRPYDKTVKKSVAKLFAQKGEIFCQIERFTADNKAHHENLPVAEAAKHLSEMAMNDYVQTDIFAQNGFCEFLVSKKGHVHIADKRKNEAVLPPSEIKSHDRQKKYLLDPVTHAGFLSLLGVSDEKGVVFEKKSSKFKQINRFLELLDDVYDKLPAEDTLTVCDLCCGKSYLTFAVYYYLTEIKKRTVTMYGVDLKRDVIEYCEEIARRLDCKGLHFLCMDINQFEPESAVDMVVSLHACDIATDIVLDFATRHAARLVLSTPCCHHEMMKQIDCEALSFITDHSMLKQKLCDAATDALRVLKLESFGYAAETLELIDAEETPKNVMIRAYRSDKRDVKKEERARARYHAAAAFLQVKPFLGLDNE